MQDRVPDRPLWRRVDTGPRSGAWNMACDAALLDAVASGASPPTVRFYAWDPPAVSLGAHQPEPDPAAAARLDAAGVDRVRRPTGGRAVYHGPPEEELTYAVVVPTGGSIDRTRGEVYHRVHQALAAGLIDLGVDARLTPRARSGKSLRPTSRLACFAASVPYEIHVGGRKLVGSAQRRVRGAILQHGSLPLSGSHAPLRAAWPGALRVTDATTVAAAAGRTVPAPVVAAALARALERVLGVTLRRAPLTDVELATIDRLCEAAPIA